TSATFVGSGAREGSDCCLIAASVVALPVDEAGCLSAAFAGRFAADEATLDDPERSLAKASAVAPSGLFAFDGSGIRAANKVDSEVTLLISLFTRLRNSKLNCAPGCESLFSIYSMFGPISFLDPMPPKVM